MFTLYHKKTGMSASPPLAAIIMFISKTAKSGGRGKIIC